MSKYYKAEDVISFLNTHCPKDMWEYQIADLPTIEVSEDCISRAKALEIYSDLYWMDERLLNFKDELDNVYEKLRNAPSVVPNRAEGEWVESEIPNELYVCSECGGACWSYDCERNIVKSNYCPNCGAKMKGAE